MTDEKIILENNPSTTEAADKDLANAASHNNRGWKVVLAALALCAIAVGTVRWWMPYFKNQPQQELVDTSLPFTENTDNDELAPLIRRLAFLEAQVNSLHSKQPTPSLEHSNIDVARLREMVSQLSAALLKVTEFE